MVNINDVNAKSTSKAREEFLSNSKQPRLPITGVRPFIYQSWLRSQSEGIKAEQFSAPIVESRYKVKQFQQNNRELYRAARGAFSQIGKMLDDAEAMLILTDCEGVVIDAIGDQATLEQGKKINLEIGGKWSESESGTNGIGTALWAGKPVFVHGTEHFCDGMSSWSCAAAPIRDPLDHSIIGAVDLSGLTKIFQKHNAAFTAAAAGEIQAELAFFQNTLRARLLEAANASVPINDKADERVAIIDRFGRIVFAKNFEGTVLPDPSNDKDIHVQLGTKLFDVTSDLSEVSDEEIIAVLPEELQCSKICRFEIGGEVQGTALVFPAQKPQISTYIQCIEPPEAGEPIMGTDLNIIGKSEVILEALEFARRITHVNTPILIEGETGVGKELFARFIHSHATASEYEPFVAINCGAVSQKMFVDELKENGYDTGSFGRDDTSINHTKGSFLCLDEIGELPLDIQPCLLRTIEERQASHHGHRQTSSKDPRLISMTNRVLLEEVEKGRFRQDLYYRLGTVALKIPPLRARGEDILLIASYFSNAISADKGDLPLIFNSEAQEILLTYSWPGNVRELRNLIGHLHYSAKNRFIEMNDLPQEMVTPVKTKFVNSTVNENNVYHLQKTEAESLRHAEKQLILQAIAKHQGNLSKAALTLGISRPTLYRKMEIYSIERKFN